MSNYEDARWVDQRLKEHGFRTKWYNDYTQVNVYGYVDDMMTFYPFNETIVFRHNGKILSRRGDVDVLIGALSSEDFYDDLVKGSDDGEQTSLF